jgi:hypothetical protein
MAENYTVEVRSRDRSNGNTTDYTVPMPQMPANKYKVTVRCVTNANSNELVLSIRGPGATRHRSTATTLPGSANYSTDCWVSFSCTTAVPAGGVMYFDGPPPCLDVRWRLAAGLTVPTVVEHQIQMHFEAMCNSMYRFMIND